MRTKLTAITLRARREPGCKFVSLAHILTVDFLEGCFRELKRDKAPGIDGVSIEEYEDGLRERLKDLVVRLKMKRYRPQPVRRVYIPKSDGSKRGLGIPTVEDKIVQLGIKKILEVIFEVDFLDVSYGFRPNRNCHKALDVLGKMIMFRPVNHIVDVDIENFFGNIDHGWLLKCLKQRIKDTSLLRLIVRFLKAGIMEEGNFVRTETGTPQGGIMSPVLANVYLHFVLDLWFEKKIKKQLAGFAELVRYADDFTVCFQNGSEARAFSRKLRQRLGKFGLKVAESKTQVIEFGRFAKRNARRKGRKVATFDFLGFTHFCDKTQKGRFHLYRYDESGT